MYYRCLQPCNKVENIANPWCFQACSNIIAYPMDQFLSNLVTVDRLMKNFLKGSGFFFFIFFAYHCMGLFKLFNMFDSFMFQLRFYYSMCYYLPYVYSISKTIHTLKLLRMLTIEYTLHSRVKLAIAQNVDCCFS